MVGQSSTPFSISVLGPNTSHTAGTGSGGVRGNKNVFEIMSPWWSVHSPCKYPDWLLAHWYASILDNGTGENENVSSSMNGGVGWGGKHRVFSYLCSTQASLKCSPRSFKCSPPKNGSCKVFYPKKLTGEHNTLRGEHSKLQGEHNQLQGEHNKLKGEHFTTIQYL